MNQIVLIGRLTRDPELRHTQSKIPVASFSLAVDRGHAKDKSEQKTDFFDIVAWRSNAEFAAKYFVKGQLIALSGQLQTRDWEAKNGNKRHSTEVIVNKFYFTGDKRSKTGSVNYDTYTDNDAPPGMDNEYYQPIGSLDFAELGDDEDELPF